VRELLAHDAVGQRGLAGAAVPHDHDFAAAPLLGSLLERAEQVSAVVALGLLLKSEIGCTLNECRERHKSRIRGAYIFFQVHRGLLSR
jgi:hypothetical protein